MPYEIWVKICSHLDSSSLKSLRLVCRLVEHAAASKLFSSAHELACPEKVINSDRLSKFIKKAELNNCLLKCSNLSEITVRDWHSPQELLHALQKFPITAINFKYFHAKTSQFIEELNSYRFDKIQKLSLRTFWPRNTLKLSNVFPNLNSIIIEFSDPNCLDLGNLYRLTKFEIFCTFYSESLLELKSSPLSKIVYMGDPYSDDVLNFCNLFFQIPSIVDFTLRAHVGYSDLYEMVSKSNLLNLKTFTLLCGELSSCESLRLVSKLNKTSPKITKIKINRRKSNFDW